MDSALAKSILQTLAEAPGPMAVHEFAFEKVQANQCTISRYLRWLAEEKPPKVIGEWRRNAKTGKRTVKEWRPANENRICDNNGQFIMSGMQAQRTAAIFNEGKN